MILFHVDKSRKFDDVDFFQTKSVYKVPFFLSKNDGNDKVYTISV